MTAPEVKVTQRAEEVAEEIVSTANIVTNGGYYEIDIDAVSAVVARFEAEVRATATTPLEARIAALEGAMGEAVQLIENMIPKNVCLTNPAWPDDTNLPMDVLLGELRKCAETAASLRAMLADDGETK